MKILLGPRLPGPFGSIKLPDIETPPLTLPVLPDEHARKALKHALGEDLAFALEMITSKIPGVDVIGGYVVDALQDIHHSEIKHILTPEEYDRFLEYNKSFPSTVAVARTLLFKEF